MARRDACAYYRVYWTEALRLDDTRSLNGAQANCATGAWRPTVAAGPWTGIEATPSTVLLRGKSAVSHDQARETLLAVATLMKATRV